MIACIEQKDKPRLCAVRWVGKKGFASVGVLTWCEIETDISGGVLQVPDNVLDGGAVPSLHMRGLTVKCCDACKTALAKIKTP